MLYDRIHEVLYNSVAQAVSRVAHLESECDEAAITKRVVRQFNKAASDESLLRMRWDEACKEFVGRAMQGYSASSADAAWYFEIDLVPALAGAAMELVNASQQACNPHGVWEICQMEYEDKLDRQMLDKALWEVCGTFFPDDDKVRGKLFHALSKSYWPALDDVLNDGNLPRDILYGLDPQADLGRVEAFTKRWLDDGISRAWAAIEASAVELSENMVQDLLRLLIAPFGEDHPFSCLPGALTERLGRPPPDWAFIKPVVSDLFRSWSGERDSQPRKKRKKAGGGGKDQADGEDEEEYLQPQAKSVASGGQRRNKGGWAKEVSLEPDEEKGAGGGGHPECTSADDCIGSTDCRLVRHLHKGKVGDLYCEPCWDSFCQRNPNLQGVFLDEEEP